MSKLHTPVASVVMVSRWAATPDTIRLHVAVPRVVPVEVCAAVLDKLTAAIVEVTTEVV